MPFVNCNKFNTSQALQDQAIADLAQELLTKQNALKDCSGNPLAGNVPTCDQMTTAIQNAIDALPADKYLQGLQSYNSATNTMTLLMSDGSTVDIDMTGLLADAVSGGAAPTGAAGGDLQGTYPNPTVNPDVVTNAVTNNPPTQTAVAGVFDNCAGTPLTPRSRLLECSAKGTDIPYLVNGVIPANQLPSFVDDVLEFPALASFPATGEAGKIYIDASTGKTYRWNGAGYTEISASAGIAVQDEGSVLTPAATSLNFVGSGINATSSGGAVTVTIPSGSPTRTTSSVPPTVAPVGNVVGSVYVDTVLDEEWVWDGARWNLLRGYKTVLGGTDSGSLGGTDVYLSLVTWTPPRANMALSVSGDIYFTWSDGATLHQDFRVHLTLRKNGLIIAGQTVMVSSGHGTQADYWANVSIAYMQLGDPNSTNEDISLGVELLETLPVEPRIGIRAHTVYIHAVD